MAAGKLPEGFLPLTFILIGLQDIEEEWLQVFKCSAGENLVRNRLILVDATTEDYAVAFDAFIANFNLRSDQANIADVVLRTRVVATR